MLRTWAGKQIGMMIAHKSEKKTPVPVIEIEINWDEHLHRWMPGRANRKTDANL
jgi:hypothetical protein